MDVWERLLSGTEEEGRLRHVESVPARQARYAPWPGWVEPDLVRALVEAGVERPWSHQVEAAEAAWAGRHVVVSTGTASGKSLAYFMPVLSALLGPQHRGRIRGDTALYLAPTKALAADQLDAVARLRLTGVRAATYDGDTPAEERRWIREHAQLVLTNPDLLHRSLLPGHSRWAGFLRGLRFVVVDECHHYRGVFGSQVAAVLRRLRRVAARYGAEPVFILASATAADPAGTARHLTGLDVDVVAEDGSPRGRTAVVLWEPPVQDGGDREAGDDGAGPGTGRTGAGGSGVPVRRSALAETADLLVHLVRDRVRTLAFVPSRRGAESVASTARRRLGESDPALVGRVATYRAGYLPEERRTLEAGLRDGSVLGMAATNALELGIDVAGLDAVLICGWPGRRASLWQQAGRAGRAGRDSVAVLVARDDPLDTYLVHHPEAVFGRELEATVLDPDNPYVLAPHLAAAAAELPLTEADLPLFGPGAPALLDTLVERGVLRRRPSGWYWTRPERAGDLTDLRGTDGEPFRIVEATTGRVLGTVDGQAAHHTVHEGAVYVHQGGAWLVRTLNLESRLALVEPTGMEAVTQARETTRIEVLATRRSRDWGLIGLHLGPVQVTSQVVSYLVRDVLTGRVLTEEPLDLPSRTLRTTAVWWTVPENVLHAHGVAARDIPGAAHAAEHAAIGMLPLVATCDRWDVGGVSTAAHPDTGLPTVFVHDGHPGGAGFAERGFHAAREWLQATRTVIDDCGCESGCPSCVQSPKCGNGNNPLDKAGAVQLLDAVLAGAGEPKERREGPAAG